MDGIVWLSRYQRLKSWGATQFTARRLAEKVLMTSASTLVTDAYIFCRWNPSALADCLCLKSCVQELSVVADLRMGWYFGFYLVPVAWKFQAVVSCARAVFMIVHFQFSTSLGYSMSMFFRSTRSLSRGLLTTWHLALS